MAIGLMVASAMFARLDLASEDLTLLDVDNGPRHVAATTAPRTQSGYIAYV